MVSTFRKSLAMIPRPMRWRWALLPPIAMLTGALEAGGAASVFALITAITQPERVAELPVVGRLAALLAVDSHESLVLALTALVALYQIVKNVVLGGGQYLRHRIIADSTAAVASRMLAAYLAAPYPFHFRRSSAALIRNVNAAPNLGEVLAAGGALASEVFVIGGVAAVMLRAAPGVTLVAGAALAVLLWGGLRLVSSAVGRVGSRQHELNRSLLRSLQNSLGGIKEAKAMGRESFFLSEFRRHQREMVITARTGMTLSTLPPLVIETVFVCGALLVISLLTLGGTTGAEGLPVLALFGYSAFRIVPAANRIAWRITEIRARGAAVADLYEDFELLGEISHHAEGDDAGRRELRDGIEFAAVSFTYPGAASAALRDVSFRLRRGEAVGIVGASGAGKSTLVDLVLGLLHPTAGRVLVDGVDLGTLAASWKRAIGYVPQQIFLLEASVRRNVAFADEHIDDERVMRALRAARIEGVVTALPGGLEANVGERGLRLSGGERQRLGIARALYHEPSLLVLDEPTSSLDPATEAAIVATVIALRGEKTVLIVSHRTEAARQCDRVLFLENGAVVDCGRFDELLARNRAFGELVQFEAEARRRAAGV